MATLPDIDVVAPRPVRPVPLPPSINPIPYRPILPDIAGNRRLFTNIVLMYREIVKLEAQYKFLKENASFLVGTLSAEDKKKLEAVLKNIAALEAKASAAKKLAEEKFKISMDKLQIWNQFVGKDLEHKYDRINVTLSVIDIRWLIKFWENNYGTARRQEIDAMFNLNKAYNDLAIQLNSSYARKFYSGFNKFPQKTQNSILEFFKMLGAKNVAEGLKDDRVEIIISDVRVISKGSQFGHVAVNIGGVVYGRAPEAWDVDSKELYIGRQSYRNSVGYVIQLNSESKQKLLASIQNKIILDKKYSIIDHSLSARV